MMTVINDTPVNLDVRVPKKFVERCQQKGVDPEEVLHSMLAELVNLNPHFHKEAAALFDEAVEEAAEDHTYLEDREAWG
ncbi:hypothetical protein ACKC9G_06825 [Pokkaliibacter sp. CJK22405]|uniref:hypothetical protein n=1 Tax=Pokkaliibacter sp. CJK22405 TaxID=3384615 RepID=UPI003984FA68